MKKEVTKNIDASQSAIEKCLLEGDLSKLTEDQRSNYYQQVCETTGLNPLTQPFQYIVLNGKLKMYALKGATDQLRRIYDISCEVKTTEKIEDLLVITVKATNNKTGRVDEDMGFAKISGLKGDMLGNAMLKATTKAKRRVTLSMCGLGMLDEDEVASIPDDNGNGKGKKEFVSSPTAKSQELKEALSDEPVQVLAPPVSSKDSKDLSDKAYEEAESLLDEAFAFCKDKDVHDRIINHLNDAKYDETKEINEVLTEFAQQHKENQTNFQTIAKENNQKWQKEMQHDAYSQLYTWMGTLDSYFNSNSNERIV
jgi:hypothetical protein